MTDQKHFDLGEAIAILSRGPATFSALLRDLPDNWVRSNEGTHDGKPTWNPHGIVGHLVYVERFDWMRRVRIVLDHGELRPFEPLDRFAMLKEFQDKSLDRLLHEFAQQRSENLAALEALNLQSEDLAKRGTHPAFGPVTLSQLLATWTTHDFTHLHQLSRVLAHQYREAVGPWSAYLGVLHCNGHSAA